MKNTRPLNRRSFLVGAATGIASTLAATKCRTQTTPRPPRILLRGSWQSVNIGDVGHTPGALSILDKHLPEAEITLWANTLGHGARDLLAKHFPRVKIIEAGSTKEGRPSSPELAAAWDRTDFLLHGSGSGFPASGDVAAFLRATGKPVGVWGVSTDPISSLTRTPEGGTLDEIRAKAAALPPTHLPATYRYILDRAAFMFTRDTISRDYLRGQQVKTPILEFGPDAQIAMTARDDEKGFAYLRAKGLEEGQFICVIPRLRWTPYHLFTNRKTPPEEAATKDAINARTATSDHASLREVIIRYVRTTKNKVLACPEMTYQIETARQQLVDPLPDDVRANVVWRDTFWMPDEAASVYAKALAVLSVECHSPLIALHQHTPAMYLRQPTDTCKGQMYPDMGAGDWFFEIEQATPGLLWSRVETILRNPASARDKAKAIMTGVEKQQLRMAEALRAAVAQK